MADRPLSTSESTEIRLAVGRLQNGARELTAVAFILPIFLAGTELAAEGFNAAGVMDREGGQRTFERAIFLAFFVVCVALAIRARIGASRAAKILPDALADDATTRDRARERIERLGGPAPVRRAAEWIARSWKLLVIVLAAIVVLAMFLPVPNPVWLAVFLAIAVAMDVRWRAMIADVADQLPRS